MAGILTHTYFILDIYDKLSIRSKELLMYEKENLKVFSLSTDILAFYKKKDKKMKEFSIYVKNHKVNDFFVTLINYIKYNDYQYNPKIIAYLYGMISHYVLDTMINPYIIYKTKNNDLEHEKLEILLDNYLTTLRTLKNPYKFKSYEYCFNVDCSDKDLIEVMDFTYKEVFKIDNFHNYYLKAIRDCKKIYKKEKYDKSGLKQKLNNIKYRKNIDKMKVTYHLYTNNRDNLFNLNHNLWFNPTNKRTKNCDSILELYTKALDRCSNIIQDINKYFYYDEKINLKKVIGNLSYETGIDCTKKQKLKYFEF